MNKYTVQYRLQGAYLKKEIKNVVEDGYIDGMPVRFFVCEDKTRIVMVVEIMDKAFVVNSAILNF